MIKVNAVSFDDTQYYTIAEEDKPFIKSIHSVYCSREVDSKVGLAFFQHRPTRDCDSYYCGCRGWD